MVVVVVAVVAPPRAITRNGPAVLVLLRVDVRATAATSRSGDGLPQILVGLVVVVVLLVEVAVLADEVVEAAHNQGIVRSRIRNV